MTALLCLPPAILDQSFPRSLDELQLAATSIGAIMEGFQKEEFELIVPEIFSEFASELFEWTDAADQALLFEVHRALANLFLVPHGLHAIDTTVVRQWRPHPVPSGCEAQGFIAIWADEAGKLLAIHDASRNRANGFCIGIACANAFSGEALGSYSGPIQHAFPLCGPEEIGELQDAFIWVTSDNITRKDVSYADAKRHLPVIGGTVHPQHGSSHHRVEFAGARSWVLDSNDDPVPEFYLRELVPITGMPLKAIKQALITGELPERRLFCGA